jgi:transposase InsO family protein
MLVRGTFTSSKKGHILGLMNVAFEKDRPCEACQAGKQVRVPHHAKNIMSTTRPLEMLHMDLFGPIAYISIESNKHGIVIIDDYSHFTWVFFSQDKSETQEVLKKFLKRTQNEFDTKVKKIRSDNGTEFKNTQIEDYVDEEGIKHEFLAPYTPQQNRVAERKNMTLIEMARTILDEYKTSDQFWVEASIRRVMPQIVSIFASFLKRHPMSSLPVTSQMSYFIVFEASAMFFKRGQSILNLLLKYMKVSCLAMIQTHTRIMFLARTLVVLKPHVTRCLMRLMAPKWSNMILMM